MCHPTITKSYSYSWIWNQMFLLIHFEIQELWKKKKRRRIYIALYYKLLTSKALRYVSHDNNKHTYSARKFPGDFANLQISGISGISRSVKHPGLKSHFAWRKSATKFLCVKTASEKVVKAFIGLTIHAKMQFWVKLTALERNRRFSIYFRLQCLSHNT